MSTIALDMNREHRCRESEFIMIEWEGLVARDRIILYHYSGLAVSHTVCRGTRIETQMGKAGEGGKEERVATGVTKCIRNQRSNSQFNFDRAAAPLKVFYFCVCF